MKIVNEPFMTIYDSRSSIRRNFLKNWFASNYDVLRFFYFLAQQTTIPIIGRLIFRPVMESYYHNIHPGSLILPRKEIEAIISKSTSLFIDPCICRILNDNCDTPIFSCLRINFAAQVRVEEKGKRLTKTEALEIIKNARKHGAILSLENCIRPYQYNICMCCTCCCVPKQFRYQFGLDVYRSGPYLPEFDASACQLCRKCEHKCPVSAISSNNVKIEVDIGSCLGCGVCADICPHQTIKMIKRRKIERDESEPGTLNLYLKTSYLHLVLAPMVFLFKLVKGEQQQRVEEIEPRQKDIIKRSRKIIDIETQREA